MKTCSRVKHEIGCLLRAISMIYTPNIVHSQISRAQQIENIFTLRFVSSFRGSILFVMLCMLPLAITVFIVCLSIPQFREGCNGCAVNNYIVVLSVVVVGGLGALNAIGFAVRCRKLPDAWGVFHEGR
jgi:hypothetical protein